MPIEPEEFRERLKTKVRAHYAASQSPLLLSNLGTAIEKEGAWWPTDKGQRSLKQLIVDTCSPDLQIVWDKKSPAYIAVVTPEVRANVEAQIEDRFATKEAGAVRLEDIARPVLLAFCIDVKNKPVYVRRSRPFRYEVGNVPAESANEFILVDPEYRRPGLRVDNPTRVAQTEKRDLEGLIQKWAAVHGIQVEQFLKLEQDDKEIQEGGKTALDRLLAVQPPDVAQRILIPADIAQILSRIR
jgi:hypothetical protein